VSAAGETVAVLRLLWAQERSAFQFLLFNAFAMPVFVAYLGLMLAGGSLDQQRWWMAGSITLGLGMGGLAQVGFAVLTDRFLGRLALLRSSPISKQAYYTAHVSLAVAESLVLVLVALALLTALGIAEPGPAGVAAGALAAVCAGSAIGGLGAALAFGARDFDSGNTAVAICALGFAVASPVFYEISALPWALRPVAWLSPFTHIAPLLRAVIAGAPIPGGALAATLGIALLLNAVSYRWARWQE
jgi:ABC-type polysaccharide/polyol phosphate export permease